MSTATKTTPDYATLRDFLRQKTASATPLPSPESTIPGGDGGKAPTEGARFQENSADIKNKGLKDNVESQTPNTETGNATPSKLIPNSGLDQTTADQDDEQTRAVKTVKGENEKMSGLDLTKDADLTAVLAGLNKAAAHLSALSVVPSSTGVRTPAPAAQRPVDQKWAAEQQAVANIVEQYRKMGSDHGRVLAHYLHGHSVQYAFLKQAEADGSMDQMMAAQDAAGDGSGAPAIDPSAAAAAPAPAPGPAPAPAPDGGNGDGSGGGAITPEDMASALAESGMTPAELSQVIELLKQKLPGADMPEDAKEKAASLLNDWTKIATDARTYVQSGKFAFKPAADGTPSRKSRDIAKGYLQELRHAGQ